MINYENRKIWENHVQITKNNTSNLKKIHKLCPSLPESMSTTHFNPDALGSAYHIQSVKKCFWCRKPRQPQTTIWETGSVGPAVSQLRTFLHANQPHTHPNTHKIWWQTTVALSSSIADHSCWTSNTSHKAQWASAPLVSYCRHGGTARALLQLYRTNTEISLSKRLVVMSKYCRKYWNAKYR